MMALATESKTLVKSKPSLKTSNSPEATTDVPKGADAHLGVVREQPITFTNATSSEVRSFISTEPGAQPIDKVVSIQQGFNPNKPDPFVWAQPVYTTVYKGKTYILEGHNRLKAVATSPYDTKAPIQQLSTEKAREMYKSKMADIEAGNFNKKIGDD